VQFFAHATWAKDEHLGIVGSNTGQLAYERPLLMASENQLLAHLIPHAPSRQESRKAQAPNELPSHMKNDLIDDPKQSPFSTRLK
jgi:hypothetical protein